MGLHNAHFLISFTVSFFVILFQFTLKLPLTRLCHLLDNKSSRQSYTQRIYKEFRCYLQSLSQGAALTEVVGELFSSEPTGCYGMVQPVQPGWGMVGTTNHPRRPTTTPLPSKQLTLMQALKRLPSVGQFVNLHLTEMSIKVKPGVIQYDFKRRTLPPGPPFSSVAPLRPAGPASQPRGDNPALT